jgi:hypothetical protein
VNCRSSKDVFGMSECFAWDGNEQSPQTCGCAWRGRPDHAVRVLGSAEGQCLARESTALIA